MLEKMFRWLFRAALVALAVFVVIGFALDLSDGQLFGDAPPTPRPAIPLAVVSTAAPTPTAAPQPTATTALPAAEAPPEPTATLIPAPTPLPHPADAPASIQILPFATDASAQAAPQVRTSSGTDADGMAYSIETGSNIEIMQVRSSANVFEDMDIVGEVRNVGDSPLEYLQIYVTVYDRAGGILGTDFTFPSLNTLQPGQSSSFRLLSVGDYASVGSYKLQSFE